MHRSSVKIVSLFIIIFTVGCLFLYSSMKAAEAARVSVVKGLLTTERCLKDPICYLEWYDDHSSLVLFTAKRTIYKLETGDIPDWKLTSGFRKQVIIKGVIEGRKIVISELVSLGGSGKISKACL
ncbi:MAG TPA: hypothetical protein QF720_06745 [Nitrospinota bacterium]|nr:hypothetical protein [Nitrospinota bacterium]